MTAVVLSAIAGWLLLSALTTVAVALLARGGSQEDDRRQRRFDAELGRLLAGGDRPRPAVPGPDGTAR
jgi:hypothetical protein